MFTVSLMLIKWSYGMQVNNISSFLVSVLFKTKSIEIQRRFTPIFMNGINCNTQYGGIVPPSKWKRQISHRNPRHIQAQTGAQRFAMVSGLNDMFPGNGVQRGLRFFSYQQQHVYKPRGIKETACTMGPSKVVYKCVRCNSVYPTV